MFLLAICLSFFCFFLLVRLFFVVKRFLFGGGVAFLHPENHCGGGGERVLWCFVQALQEKDPNVQITLYSAHAMKFLKLQEKVEKTFNIMVAKECNIVPVTASKKLVNFMTSLPFSLLSQSVASVILSIHCLLKYTPDYWVDTTGYAFSYPVARILAGCKVVCYTHYPTISTDMLDNVKKNIQSVNNPVELSPTKTNIKIWYYRLFSRLYGVCGYFADIRMVNSSWTQGHVKAQWLGKNPVNLVYPPVPAEQFYHTIPLAPEKRQPIVLSIGQFRREKNHAMQINAFKRMLEEHGDVQDAKLVLLGGSKDKDCDNRIKQLKIQVDQLKLNDRVIFAVNAPYHLLLDYLGKAIVGLHTMKDEHFGICAVEFQAAGVIPLAHNSAGPKMDIVVEREGQPTGFLAITEEEYAEKMYFILSKFLSEDNLEMREIQKNAKESSRRFSEEIFRNRVLELWK